VVKTHEIAEDPAKAAVNIGRQLNLGVTGVMFVGVESAEEVKAGLAAMRFKSKGGTRPEDVGAAPLEKLVAKPMSDRIWKRLDGSAWVRDGRADAPRVVYTFSDANCPYCHRFWEAARPWVDSGKVQLRHVMVGVIREDSPAKAAAILGAPNPSAVFLQNEHDFSKGGIKPAATITPALANKLDANQVLMVELGFQGTPGILFRDAQGMVQRVSGMPQGEDMEKVMGPR
jgi:thiol:disulfide interchange protein DsbG